MVSQSGALARIMSEPTPDGDGWKYTLKIVSPDIAEKIKVISTMSTNAAIAIKDEGTSITSAVKNINFVGATVTATNSGDD